MNDNLDLLRDYARNHSEDAFAALVSRHVNLVYSVALRQVGNAGLAEEITQAVFIILARKAGSLGDKTILSGWLCRTARYTSANALTIQRRRQRREQEAFMQNTLTGGSDASSHSEELWKQIAPLLDAAMERLGQKDHDALVLRFFENKNFAEVGAALGASEDAAKMRVSRALEKLRKFFLKRGVDSPVSAIVENISANSIQVAPAALAKSITAVAVVKGVTAGGSTLTLIKGALKIMAWTKVKTAAVVGAVVILAAGTTTAVVKHQHSMKPQISGPISENAWTMSGYATPEAAFQSALWAMSKGDLKTVADSYTADFGNQFMETAGKGKSDAELSALFVQIAGMIGEFQVVRREAISSDEAILHFRSPRMVNASVPLKKVGSEWKLNGNITSDAPANGVR